MAYRGSRTIHATCRDRPGVLVPKLTHGSRIASGNRGKSAIRPTHRHDFLTPQFYNLPLRQVRINLNNMLKHIRAGGITPPLPSLGKYLRVYGSNLGCTPLFCRANFELHCDESLKARKRPDPSPLDISIALYQVTHYINFTRYNTKSVHAITAFVCASPSTTGRAALTAPQVHAFSHLL